MFGDFMTETGRRILGKASILWPESSPPKKIEVGRILAKSICVGVYICRVGRILPKSICVGVYVVPD